MDFFFWNQEIHFPFFFKETQNFEAWIEEPIWKSFYNEVLIVTIVQKTRAYS